MNILAINFNHDGAAALLRDGRLAGYVCTERFSRRKKHPGVRACDVQEILAQARIGLRDLDLVQLLNLNNMDSPEVVRLHGGDLKDTWPEFWVNATYTRMNLLGTTLPCSVALSAAHHAMHAAAAYFFAPFESAVSLACDPIGTHAFFMQGIQPVHIAVYHHLVAPRVYDKVAEAQFGTGLVGAGKLMGLAPYGADTRRIDYEQLTRMPYRAAFQRLVELTKDDAIVITEAGGTVFNATLAFHAQALLEFELTRLFEQLYAECLRLGVEPNLCLAGGTALNSVANQRCFAASQFRDLYLFPACGDDGTAIGAALMEWHVMRKQPKLPRTNREAMYSCRSYDGEVAEALRKQGGHIVVEERPDYVLEAARLIADGKVIGWFQGASEIGPRALGNRSILADARRPHMKDYLNGRIKQREGFRPFAPSILREHAAAWFGIESSPFMLRVAPVRNNLVPAVTHVDGTTRFQTVAEADNPAYHRLIAHVLELTGVPLVLNTSFNGKGEPIVETPQDALECMLSSRLDALVFPGRIVRAAALPVELARGNSELARIA